MSLKSPMAAAPLLVALACLVAGPALAQTGPFGVGLPEPAPSGGGILGIIAHWQSAFYRDLTTTIRAMKDDGTATLWLCTLAFAYGVLHAAGPGHGKAIVSAYVLANRETARNGAILALVSAFAQGVTAVAMVGVAAALIGATSIAMTQAALWMEVASFALIAALGLWLTHRKVIRPILSYLAQRYAPVDVTGARLALAGHAHQADEERHHHGHHHGHRHDHGHDHGHAHHHAHGHGHAEHGAGEHGHADDCGCGHAHVAPPEAVSGPLDWRKAWTTVLAVGIRPCTGALIILVFALSQGLFAGGVAATFAMALGTGLTVAAITLAAVGARGLAARMTGGGSAARRLHVGVEALGALMILAFGILMLGASLTGLAG